MAITLSPDVERLIAERVERGGFASADEFIMTMVAAYDVPSAHVLDDETLAAIDEAERQIEAGDVYRWEDVREEIRAMFVPQPK